MSIDIDKVDREYAEKNGLPFTFSRETVAKLQDGGELQTIYLNGQEVGKCRVEIKDGGVHVTAIDAKVSRKAFGLY